MADFPLLNEASLVMIPGATKEGKVYSQVPTDGSGDFTFTRSTSATRVNEAGNIEKGYENLLLQSNQLDTTWITPDATITSGQADKDGSNNAWLLTATSAFNRVAQSVSQSGVKRFSVYAKANTNDYLLLGSVEGAHFYATFNLATGAVDSNNINAISPSIENVGNGWYRCSATWVGTTTEVRIASQSTSGQGGWASTTSGSIYIQDAQLNQGLVAYPYLETTTAPVYGGLQSDQPRLDYTDATCPSLLLEPSRTNLINHSEYFEGWHTDANVSYIANSTISPEGLINAAKLTATNTSNAYVRDNINGSAGNNVFSVFAKYEDCQYIYLSTRFFNGGDEARVWFDIQNGVKGSSTGDDATYDIEDYGNGWYRCYVIFNIDAGDTNGYSYIYLSNTDGSSNVTSGTSAHLYGGQFEVGSYPTSYIPTYGSAESRGEDVLGNSNDISGLFNDNEGTLYFETNDRIFKDETTNKNFFGLTESSSGNYFRFRGSISNILAQSIGFGSNISFNPSGATLTKYLYKWDGSTIKLFVDGVERSSASQTATFNPDLFRIGFNFGFVSNTKQLSLFSAALTDTECIALTTL